MGSDQRNAILAVVLSGIILFTWQYLYQPQKTAPIEPATQTVVTTSGQTATPAKIEGSTGPIEPVAAQNYALNTDKTQVSFSNTLDINGYNNEQAVFNFKETVGEKPFSILFDFGNGFKPLSFVADNSQPGVFKSVENEVTLTAKLDMDGVTHLNIVSPKPFKYKMSFTSTTNKLENGQNRVFAYFSEKLKHLDIGSEETGDTKVKWAGVDFNYHLFAVYFENETPLLFQTKTDNTFTLSDSKEVQTLDLNFVFVKKEYNYLSRLGHNLQGSVDFGIWGFFAVWILKGLQFFYEFFPNYGVSIILLTLVIRLITFPLQYKSFASMKKLQLIQPELTKIREKFKDDPMKLQKESMDLFKKSGANPLGGCLPLILQMPVFFAFYKVLYAAVELVDAPFYGWIHDLSNKDPYYVLPVLMTGAMFLQQKLTPNTVTDPVQKKMMMFMPLIFGFIMKDLPSGLSLYIFVSTLMGIAQQLLVFKSMGTNKAVVVA
jgi:YidC/Oxa1 family membrane protein insertase